jgi:hypothetical protein
MSIQLIREQMLEQEIFIHFFNEAPMYFNFKF